MHIVNMYNIMFLLYIYISIYIYIYIYYYYKQLIYAQQKSTI